MKKKIMATTLCCLLIISALLSALSCTTKNVELAETTWVAYASSLKQNGKPQIFDTSDGKMIKKAVFTFYADGTVYTSDRNLINGQSEKYEINGNTVTITYTDITNENQHTLAATVKNDKMTFVKNGYTYVFKKQEPVKKQI